MSLSYFHLADLRQSGLVDRTIEIMGAYSARPADIPKLIGWDPQKVESALVFPYPGVNGFCRVKVFPSYEDKQGHEVKYLQREGSGVHLYVLPPVRKVLGDPSIPLYFSEGEKKTAKGIQEKLLCVGIGGLWNWLRKGTGEGIEELDLIAWPDREAIITPDSDIWTRLDLQRAVFAFGKELESRGAKVSVVVIPEER